MLSAKFIEEQLSRVNVAMNRLRRLFGYQRHSNGGSKVIHRIDSPTDFLNQAWLCEIGLNDLQVGIPLVMAQVIGIARTEIIDHENFIAACQKIIRQMRTDKSAPSGNQNTHEKSLAAEVSKKPITMGTWTKSLGWKSGTDCQCLHCTSKLRIVTVGSFFPVVAHPPEPVDNEILRKTLDFADCTIWDVKGFHGGRFCS